MLTGRMRLRAAIGLLLLLLAGTAAAAPAKRVILISWDGAANWVVERLLAEGRLPHLARLAAMGVSADGCMPASPSKTACGHAALWTGAWGDVNGITGNLIPRLPRADHTLLEWQSSLGIAGLRAEPIWLPALRAGKRAVTLSNPITGLSPTWRAELQAARIPIDRFVAVGSYGALIAPERVWDGSELLPAEGWTQLPAHRGTAREFALRIGDAQFFVFVYDDPDDPIDGADTLLIRQGSKEAGRAVAVATLKPREAGGDGEHFSPRFRVTKGEMTGFAYFRLFALAPDGRMTLYQRVVNGLPPDASEAQRQYSEATGGCLGGPSGYENGALGKTLWQGGDGTAERRYLECLWLQAKFFQRGLMYARGRWKPDLLIHYLPFADGAGHKWVGALDPDSPCYDAALARKLWPYYAAVYQLLDEGLGDLLDHLDKETAVCLVSDHGMAGTSRMVSVNVILERAGLLGRTPDGKIDLARTKIGAPPWGDYFLVVNGTDWKGGIVPPAERAAVLRAAEEALLTTTDPVNGRHVVTGIFRPGATVGLGLGGPAGGDLYLDVAPGYEPISDAAPGSESLKQWATEAVWTWPSPIGGGAHGFFPLRAKMQGIFFLGGAGVASGVRLSGIRQIDVAPTVARLLGISAPRDAHGRVLGEALDPQR